MLHWNPPGLTDKNRPESHGGQARGTGGTDASVTALVPDVAALTTKEQPTLFWFQSKEANARLEVTVIEPGKPKPLLVAGSASAKPGIHRIRLARYGVKLAPDVTYRWSVSLIPNPSSRSLDAVASGNLKRIEPSKELAQEVAGAKPADLPAIYAQAGIWYDALDAISNEIDANPTDNSLRQERADLMKQAGLPAPN